MKILPLSFDRPELNLAFEDWYFEHFEEDTLRIWRNGPSVIVGKHQNALAECNLHFCRQQSLPVVRRISGGGTVYHDSGNLNFSFFRHADRERLIDYDTNLGVITGALHKLGYPVTVSERHDLFREQYKISGNAQHIRKGKALHHGTILYDANLSWLRSSIKRTSGTFEDKAVKSVRSPVANLRDLQDAGTAEDFELLLLDALYSAGYKNITIPVDDNALRILAGSKYTTPEWNFGYSPAYRYTNGSVHAGIVLDVERGGRIARAEACWNQQPQRDLSESLAGKFHFYDHLAAFFETTGWRPEEKKEWLNILF